MINSQQTKKSLLKIEKILNNFLEKEASIRARAKKSLQASIKDAEGKKARELRKKINSL